MLSGKKTYIVAGLGILAIVCSAASSIISGEMTITQFFSSTQFMEILGFLGLGTPRAGVAKTEVK